MQFYAWVLFFLWKFDFNYSFLLPTRNIIPHHHPHPLHLFLPTKWGGDRYFNICCMLREKMSHLRREKRKICCYPEFLVPASLASSSLAIPRSLEVFLPPALLLNFMSALNLDQATTDSIIPDYTVHSIQVTYILLNSISVKMAEPIGPKFCVKDYGWLKFQKFASI